MNAAEFRSESGRLKPRLSATPDGRFIIHLEVAQQESKTVLNENLSLCLMVEDGLRLPEVTSFMRSLELACSDLLFIVNSEHRFFRETPDTLISTH